MFKLEISTEFKDDRREELARILEHVAHRLRGGETVFLIRDRNGNRVGRGELKPC